MISSLSLFNSRAWKRFKLGTEIVQFGHGYQRGLLCNYYLLYEVQPGCFLRFRLHSKASVIVYKKTLGRFDELPTKNN
jgi:hypothetical protein